MVIKIPDYDINAANTIVLCELSQATTVVASNHSINNTLSVNGLQVAPGKRANLGQIGIGPVKVSATGQGIFKADFWLEG